MATKKKQRRFEAWEFEQINKVFGCIRHYKGFPLLEAWLQADDPITETEQEALTELADEMFRNAEAWNEDELKFFFISPLIKLVNFRHQQYKPFTQRKLSGTIGEWAVSGIVDFVIATGIQHPAKPFFFLHEYKQERKGENDPLGQLLIAMLVAQQRNEVDKPLYGCYVVGRYYFFVVLIDHEYSVSNSLNGSDAEDVLQIFRMFRFVKRKIEAQLAEELV